jgi:hypothetical protein
MRRVKRLYGSNLCIILLLLNISLLFSCKQKNAANTPELRIAKTVPEIFYSATDTGFSLHLDTVLYQQKYFTGFRVSLYPNGDTAAFQSYFNGVEEGTQKKWYPNRQLAEERFYINGKKEGTHRGWWPDGKPKFLFYAVGDAYTGEFREWYSTGILAKDFHYVNGQEEGSEKLWWDNGTVRANYVIRNGKKYGLIGLTICNNPYDSVNKK